MLSQAERARRELAPLFAKRVNQTRQTPAPIYNTDRKNLRIHSNTHTQPCVSDTCIRKLYCVLYMRLKESICNARLRGFLPVKFLSSYCRSEESRPELIESRQSHGGGPVYGLRPSNTVDQGSPSLQHVTCTVASFVGLRPFVTHPRSPHPALQHANLHAFDGVEKDATKTAHPGFADRSKQGGCPSR